MSTLLRIAILECDTLIDAVKGPRGTYGDIFQSLFQKGLSELDTSTWPSLVQFSTWDVVEHQQYPRLEVDGILMTGSSKDYSTDMMDLVVTAYRA